MRWHTRALVGVLYDRIHPISIGAHRILLPNSWPAGFGRHIRLDTSVSVARISNAYDMLELVVEQDHSMKTSKGLSTQLDSTALNLAVHGSYLHTSIRLICWR